MQPPSRSKSRLPTKTSLRFPKMKCMRLSHVSLTSYLAQKVFGGEEGERMDPVASDVEGFEAFMQNYKNGLAIERAAVESLK